MASAVEDRKLSRRLFGMWISGKYRCYILGSECTQGSQAGWVSKVGGALIMAEPQGVLTLSLSNLAGIGQQETIIFLMQYKISGSTHLNPKA